MVGFAGLGVFVVSLIFVTVFVLICGAVTNNEFGFEVGCIGGLIVILILLLAYLSWTGVSFEQNPEMYGYTRIEQEVNDG